MRVSFIARQIHRGFCVYASRVVASPDCASESSLTVLVEADLVPSNMTIESYRPEIYPAERKHKVTSKLHLFLATPSRTTGT